jgi:putative transposase
MNGVPLPQVVVDASLCYTEGVQSRTFRYRLYPTPAQETALEQTLEDCRWLYNRLLEERTLAWQETETRVTLYQQHARIPLLKTERPGLAQVHSQVLQNVAVRIDLAFQAFFRRVKAGETPGYPRFRGRGWYDSFCYPQAGRKGGYWLSADGQHVHLSKVGEVALAVHRPLEGSVKTCCVRRTATGKWFVTFSCVVEDRPLPASAEGVGLDVGLASFATLSTGEQIANPRFFRKDEKALAQVQRVWPSARRERPHGARRSAPSPMCTSASPTGARTLPISTAGASSTASAWWPSKTSP